MFRLQDAMRALRNRWVFTILLLIQFTYGLSTMTGTISIFFNLHYLNTKSLLDLDTTYLASPNLSYWTKENLFTKDHIQEIFEKLEDHPNVIRYGTYYEDIITFEDANQLDSRLANDLMTSRLPIPLITTIIVDESYYHLLNMNIKDGQGFSDADFHKGSNEIIPILAGTHFKTYYDIGDLIKDQYRIVGFLPNGYIVNNNTTNIYMKQDKMIMMPMSLDRYNDYTSMFYRLHLGTVLQLQPDTDLDALSKIMTLPESDITITIRNLGEEVRSNAKIDVYAQIPHLLLGLFFILFSIIGIVVTTIVSILIRQREFGIRLALGESTRGLFTQIVMEISITGIVGLGLSLAHFAWKYRRLMQVSSEWNTASSLNINWNINVLLSTFSIMLAIIIIASLILYPYIKKQELKSLIGGME